MRLVGRAARRRVARARSAPMELLTPRTPKSRSPSACCGPATRAVEWDGAARDRRSARRGGARGARSVPGRGGVRRARCRVPRHRRPDWDQWLASRSRPLATRTSKRSRSRAPTACSSRSSCPANRPSARRSRAQMIDRTHALGTRSGEAQFRKNLLMARFHVDDALEETLVVGAPADGAAAEPAPARPRRSPPRARVRGPRARRGDPRDPRQRLRVHRRTT